VLTKRPTQPRASVDVRYQMPSILVYILFCEFSGNINEN
jgi:hypothetical protein